MSVLQKLTEGVQSRDMQAEGAALLNKWEATGLLEGLNDGQQKQGMAVLLENQAKELLREASSMAAGDVEGFAAVAFPIVRRVFGGLIAQDLISVQPMSLPSGLIFFLDFTHESTGESLYGGRRVGREILDGIEVDGGFFNLGKSTAAAHVESGTGVDPNTGTTFVARLAATDLDAANEDFDPDLDGQDRVVVRDLTITGGAQLDPGQPQSMELEFTAHDITNADANVMRTVRLSDGTVAFVAASAGGNGVFQCNNGQTTADHLQALVVRPARRLAKYATQNNATDGLKVVTAISRYVLVPLDATSFARSVDLEATTADLGATVAGVNPTTQASLDSIDEKALRERIELAISDPASISADTTRRNSTAANVVTALMGSGNHRITVKGPARDQLADGTGLGSIVGADTWALEEPLGRTGNSGSIVDKQEIAEIDIKVDSVAVTAQTKKLKAKWSPELGQDLNAYHNLDAEVELTGILSEQIALEIDRELLGELVRGATAGTRYWSRAPGLFVDSAGAPLGATSAAPDFTGTVSEWYETLIETINDVSAQIHRKTLRGGANFVVCSPEVANILEFTSGFRASVTADQDRGTIGAVRAGSLSKKFDVYVDPYFLRNVILVGRKGSSFLESGYVYAPYVPLQVTPTIFGTEDFVPRKGVMTRYAKKMVRPDMYGLVVVRGLLGEEMPS